MCSSDLLKSAILALCLGAASSIQLPGTWGYEVANETYGVNYFYWYFEPQNGNADAPVVMWLTGGPGCSSELALFFENGPYQVNQEGTNIQPNKYGWNQENYLLYVDQPGGTGFSTVTDSTGYVTNQAQVAQDMLTFLTNFFTTYSDLADNDFYIFGESFAGHYVPAIGAFLVQNAPEIPLKACAIGNGLIDPYYINPSYGPFVFDHGLMTASQLQQTQAQVPQCQSEITKSSFTSAFSTCGNILNDALTFCGQNKGSQCNVYNIEAPCNGQLCYDFDNIVTFLNSAAVQQELNVSIQWQPCNDGQVYNNLEGDFEKSYAFDLPIILAAGVPVTVYNGALDIICNFYGEAETLANLAWPGQNGFNGATNQTWTVAGQTAGTYKTYQNLTFVVVANAGHMVPHDQPANALALMETVLANNW